MSKDHADETYNPARPNFRRGNLAADAGRMLDPSQWEWRREGADSAAWRGFIGFLARFIVWCENLFGWAASLLLVAVLSGLAKKDDA